MRGRKRGGMGALGRVGGLAKKIGKKAAKKGGSLTYKHRKTLARGALYGAGAAASAYTGNPGPLTAAKMADSALFSRRNRSSMGAIAKPTGAKGF